jgi:zinc/manganese transport system substrate-binding protein
MKKILALLLLCLPLSVFAGVRVVTSFSVLGDLVRQIGGDRVSVVSLVGPNQDAHVFQPSPSDVKQLSNAQLFVVNGLGMEGWISRLTRSAGFRGLTVEATRGVLPIREAGETHVDPHAWHDPVRLQNYIQNIESGLIKVDPAGATIYRQRAQDFSRRVLSAHQWAQAQFSSVPTARRKVVTSHDAFGYLGSRYQIRFLAPQGISTEAEASAMGVAKLVRQLRAEKVRAVFFENMTDQHLLKQIAAEAHVSVSDQLYSDALSAAGGPADSWEKMFRYNVATIMRSLK